MDLTLKYSKTSKGAKAVLAKSRALPSNCMLVLSHIDGKMPAAAILAKLQLNEEKFSKALAQLLEEAYIQVVQDFGPTVFDLNSAIEVSEISTEEFLKLELPEEQDTRTQEQIEAEARARAYAEEQARKEAQAREQEEAERKLLIVTDILAKSGHKIDIEKLAEPKPDIARSVTVSPAPASQAPDGSPSTQVDDRASLDFTQSAIASTTDSVATEQSSSGTPDVHVAPEEQPHQAAEDDARHKANKGGDEEAKQREMAAQAQRESEVRAKAEADRRAIEASERRAREKAEAEAKAREEEQRKAEEKARKAQEKARQEEERRVRKEAEAARKRAEQQAREEEKARAKAEAERKAREEAERKAKEKAEAEAKARETAERKAKERAALEARRAAEAEAKAEADRKAREEARLRKEALAIERAAAKEEARRQAEARAIVRAENWARKRAAFSSTTRAMVPSLFAVGRPLLIGVAGITVVLLVLLQFISLSLWSSSVEQKMALSIGEPVQIRDLHVSLWPRPHLILQDVAAGPIGDITARTVEVYPDMMSLLKSHTTLHSVVVEGLILEQGSLQRPLDWIASSVKQQSFQTEHIRLQNVTIKVPDMELPSFDAESTLDQQGALVHATLTANNISAEIKPQGEHKVLSMQAQNWQLPIGAPLLFDELTAQGTIMDTQVDFSKIEGSLYGGSLKGILSIDWSSGWKAAGNFELAKVDLAQVTPVISDFAHLRGRVYARADLAMSGEQVHQLMKNPSIQARFEVEQGELGGLDLARAASGREQVGGVTRFDLLSGNWALQDQQYQLSQLDLKAGSLSAQGEVGISPEQNLAGKVQTRLDLSSRQLQARFNISGKLGNARISR